MQPSAYPIPLDLPGRLWIMPKPSAEWLSDDIAAWRSMGMDRIVSLVAHDEAAELGLAGEADVCRKHGMDFVHLPIPDRGLPEQRAFAALAHETLGALRGGMAVGVHCRAGIGRSGMLACCVLALSGLTAEEAIARVSEARRITVPDTEAQAAFIRGIVAHMQSAPAATIDGHLNAH
jgi:hypothetical protein